jgi:hypothetical protein
LKTFVVHRHGARGVAQERIRSLGVKLGVPISPVLLPRSSGESWKAKAIKEIQSSEIVVAFDPDACSGSENTRWELEQAKRLGKKIIEVRTAGEDLEAETAIRDSYELQDEFNECFNPDAGQIDREMELYKLMVETSEQLILRRQRTNAFFITIIGSLTAVIGLLIKEGIASQNNTWVLLLVTIPGIILCNSWRNQIDNYGKLNAGKFNVILKMEKAFPVQIFSAEWISLGKGMGSVMNSVYLS